MAAQPDVDDLIQRTRRYEFQDGLRDLQLGLLVGLNGAVAWVALQPFWFQAVARLAATYGRWAAWLGMLLAVLPVIAALGALGAMGYFRRRWLWARSGLVKPSPWAVPRRVNLLAGAILLGGIALALLLRFLGTANNDFVLGAFWVATGWSFGYTLMAVGRNLGLPRYMWVGALGAGSSTVILVLRVTFAQSALLFGVIWFLLLGISGAVTLRRAWLAVREVGDARSESD